MVEVWKDDVGIALVAAEYFIAAAYFILELGPMITLSILRSLGTVTKA